MPSKYKTLVFYRYSLLIWDNCYASIETNGARYRITYEDSVRNGNTESCKKFIRYYSIEEGEKILKAFLCAKSMWDHGKEPQGYMDIDVLTEGLTSNYSNAPASSDYPLDELPIRVGF